jgi:hypothetical protein
MLAITITLENAGFHGFLRELRHGFRTLTRLGPWAGAPGTPATPGSFGAHRLPIPARATRCRMQPSPQSGGAGSRRGAASGYLIQDPWGLNLD